jgi:hypothetical protein
MAKKVPGNVYCFKRQRTKCFGGLLVHEYQDLIMELKKNHKYNCCLHYVQLLGSYFGGPVSV